MRVYVASSWRNTYQPTVVSALRHEGFDVYDFRNPEPGNDGFSWRAIDPDWEAHREDVAAYLNLIAHPVAEAGFKLDMDALSSADIVIGVLPFGLSAGLEVGYAHGAGKPMAIFAPAIREPELMLKVADLITDDIDHLLSWARQQRKAVCHA